MTVPPITVRLAKQGAQPDIIADPATERDPDAAYDPVEIADQPPDLGWTTVPLAIVAADVHDDDPIFPPDDTGDRHARTHPRRPIRAS